MTVKDYIHDNIHYNLRVLHLHVPVLFFFKKCQVGSFFLCPKMKGKNASPKIPCEQFLEIPSEQFTFMQQNEGKQYFSTKMPCGQFSKIPCGHFSKMPSGQFTFM